MSKITEAEFCAKVRKLADENEIEAAGIPALLKYIIDSMWDHAHGKEDFAQGVGYLVKDTMELARFRIWDAEAPTDNEGEVRKKDVKSIDLSEDEYTKDD